MSLAWLDDFVAKPPSTAEALQLLSVENWHELAPAAVALRERAWGNHVSYSRKVFVPLTQLCRDVCHYCTFAKAPRALAKPFLLPDDVLAIARQGAAAGCKEVLFTLGDKPELRYASARNALAELGFDNTLAYLEHVARLVVKETGLLPHLNPGLMTVTDFQRLRLVAPSMGIMLESSSQRLCERGMPHFGSPDKAPARRLETLRIAGELRVPMTTGILIGIGETRRERIESLLALRDLHHQFGHLQEIIIQNFRAKPGTKMHTAAEPSMEDLCWTVAVARLIFGAQMSIQAPPNLYTGALTELIRAGINDWGGVSPVTPDHVNPEAPWPHLDDLAEETERAGHCLVERLTIYPKYIENRAQWLAPELHAPVLRLSDGGGLARPGPWAPGLKGADNIADERDVASHPTRVITRPIARLVERAATGSALSEAEVAVLFTARGGNFNYICQAADALRKASVGDTVRYVVTRNINYTNVCLYHCGFCAFSKGKTHEDLRGQPYMVELSEIARRVQEAWQRGATEVCMQGGIHPAFTGETYLNICRTAKEAAPQIHVHAFSPLEITHGAKTLGLSIEEFLQELKSAGLGSLPGTAAEILDDDVRREICPDKVSTQEWLNIMGEAHHLGLPTTSTIMFGHLENYSHWARHLLRLRDQQQRSGGFTEFVPLPFVHMEAPLYLKGRTRKGPSLRETILMHAVARLVLHPHIRNIQVSWVKVGPRWAQYCLQAGANDMGGTLMNESISRAAGASHGQELNVKAMEALIRTIGREPQQRTTLYTQADAERHASAKVAVVLQEAVNAPLLRPRREPVQSIKV